jgi:hypothetical protein
LYAKTKVEKILDAIAERDVASLKGLFSKSTVEAVGEAEIEAGAEYLFTVIEGDVVSVEMKRGDVSESVVGGKSRKVTYIDADVETSEGAYNVYCRDDVVDEADPGNVGLTLISIARTEDSSKYGTPRDTFRGVYRPEQVREQLEYAFNIPHSYETEYGSFTVPPGYCKNMERSAGEVLFFDAYSFDAVFSISAEVWGHDADEAELFRENIEPDLRAEISTAFPADDYEIAEEAQETKHGYPMEKLVVREGVPNQYGQQNMEIYYYIIGNARYVVLHVREAWRDEGSLAEVDGVIMSIADSFVWAE